RHTPGDTWINSLAWHPDGRRLAVGYDDCTIHLWDVESAAELMPPWVHGSSGLVLAFNHAGDRLVCVSCATQASLWDTAPGRPLLRFSGFFSAQFSGDDRLLGPEIHGNQVRLWRVAFGRELRVLRRCNPGRFNQLASPVLHAGDRILAAGGSGGL